MKMSRFAALVLAFAFGGCTVVELDFYATTTSGTGSTSTSTASGMTLCSPGETRSCYSGPAGTEGQGICAAGAETCAADGMSWGACVGEVLPQAENCATPEDEDCNGKAEKCPGTLQWATRFGGADDQHATGVAVDAAGNVLVTGYFSGAIDTVNSAGGNDVFVAKLDGGTGAPIWFKGFGDASDQRATGVAVDAAGNVLVTGYFSGAIDTVNSAGGNDVFVAKLDGGTGAPIWFKGFGDASDQRATGVAVDAAGNVLVTGYFSGAINTVTSVGGNDVFVGKLAGATGAPIWFKGFGDASDQRATGVAVDAAGNVLVTGYFSGAIDFGSGAMASTGGINAFVAKLNASADPIWSEWFGAAAPLSVTEGRSVAVGALGEVCITGDFGGTVDFGTGSLSGVGVGDAYLMVASPGGQATWSKHFGAGTAFDSASGVSVALDTKGNVLVTGDFSGAVNFGLGPLASAGGSDVFLGKLNAAGEYVWAQRFGDFNEQRAAGVAVDASGDVVVAGYFSGAIDLGAGWLQSAGGQDVFVAKFAE